MRLFFISNQLTDIHLNGNWNADSQYEFSTN